MNSLCSVPQLAHPTVVPASCVFSVDWILKEAVWTTSQPQVLSLTNKDEAYWAWPKLALKM